MTDQGGNINHEYTLFKGFKYAPGASEGERIEADARKALIYLTTRYPHCRRTNMSTLKRTARLGRSRIASDGMQEIAKALGTRQTLVNQAIKESLGL